MTRLAAAQCRDTLRILRPAAVVLAPALGLLSGCGGVVASNAYRVGDGSRGGGGLPRPGGPVVALARELFWEPRPGVATRVTRSRSKPAAHLDAADAGALLGVALLGGPRNAIDAALRDRGITTNAVRGKPSGISFARFRRLVRLLRDTLRDPTTHALGRNMWLQVRGAPRTVPAGRPRATRPRATARSETASEATESKSETEARRRPSRRCRVVDVGRRAARVGGVCDQGGRPGVLPRPRALPAGRRAARSGPGSVSHVGL